MDLSFDDLNKALLDILTGKRIIEVPKDSLEEVLLLKQPTNYMKVKADYIYEKSYKEAISNGLMSLPALEALIKEKNLYTDEDEQQIEKLKSQLNAQKIILTKTTKVRAHQDRLKKIINKIEGEIVEIKYKRISKLAMSADNKAEEDKHSYLCSICVYDFFSEELRWKSYEDLMSETELSFRNDVLSDFLKFYSGYSQEVIRYIARNGLWRIRYMHSQKTSEPLFGIPAAEYSNDQLNLVYWANFYQNVYEMMPEDRPSDDTIEDDIELDAYMKDYYEQKTREDAARKSKIKIGGKMSAFDKEEVIVTNSNELAQEIKYDKPREARKYKEAADLKAKTRHSKSVRMALNDGHSSLIKG